MFDVLIKNGTIIDGTGKNLFRGDVGIKENKIVAVGDLSMKKVKPKLKLWVNLFVLGLLILIIIVILIGKYF